MSPDFAEIRAVPTASAGQFHELFGVSADEFCREADAGSVGLSKDELARVLLVVGKKYNYGLAPGISATRLQSIAFWRSLQLKDLALAHACALGRDAAWDRFLTLYRQPLTQVAIAITGSWATGQELADSLYSEMFDSRNAMGSAGRRWLIIPGAGLSWDFCARHWRSGTWIVHRRCGRETSLPAAELVAPPLMAPPDPEVLARLAMCLKSVLARLDAEERFVLSAWFLDRRTLAEISRMLRVHEATVSRRIGRLTGKLQMELLAGLQASGMSKAKAMEALGTDPRDIDINLRTLLQSSSTGAFSQQSESAEPERT